MKLYIKEKRFSATDHFVVKDEKGKTRYEIHKKFGISVGLKLHIFDKDGKELGHIAEKKMSVAPSFKVIKDGEQVATIVKKFSLMKPRYEVEELDWVVKGDFRENNYKIEKDSKVIMKIHKKLMAQRDVFELDVADEKNELVALAVVIAIDCMLDEGEEK